MSLHFDYYHTKHNITRLVILKWHKHGVQTPYKISMAIRQK